VGTVGPGEYRPGPQPHLRMKCNPGRSSCNPRQLKGTQPPPPFAACAACTWQAGGLREPAGDSPNTRRAPSAKPHLDHLREQRPFGAVSAKAARYALATYRRLRHQVHAAKAEADCLLAESFPGLGQFLHPMPPRRKHQRGRRSGPIGPVRPKWS
jgi:hypothetical protein